MQGEVIVNPALLEKRVDSSAMGGLQRSVKLAGSLLGRVEEVEFTMCALLLLG